MIKTKGEKKKKKKDNWVEFIYDASAAARDERNPSLSWNELLGGPIFFLYKLLVFM